MKTAVLLGASGNVGGHLLQLLLDDHQYSCVKAIVRTEIDMKHSKLHQIITEYTTIDQIKTALNCDVVFIILAAKDKEINANYPVKLANICKEQGARTIGIVSAIGADINSSVAF